jgi:2',3'-cyclic-nucleotide 2'-phosphodiesterase (5'-nucleotidase family)
MEDNFLFKQVKVKTRIKMTHLILIFIIIILGLIFPACHKQSTIILYHINDIHAKIDNFAKIAWLLQQERSKHTNVFFLVGGDNFSGNPVVDQYNPRGEPMLELLNRLKVDVMTMGNHDFDYGQEVLKNFMQRAQFPILCANVNAHQGIIPQPEPFYILETKDKLKIAVLGLLALENEDNTPSTHPLNIKGLTFNDPLETAKNFKYLKDKSDIFIALTHLGSDIDEKLAQALGELDLIVGAHSHTVIKNMVEVNGVRITQAGSQARYLGRIELTHKSGVPLAIKSELIQVDSIQSEDPEIKEKIKEYNDNPTLDQVITNIDLALQGKDQLGNIITDGIRQELQLDVVFHNKGGIRSYNLGEKITIKDVYKMVPFLNEVVHIKMTLDEIRGFIKYDFERHKDLDLKVSGIQYTVFCTPEKEVIRVELKDRTGKPLDKSKTYEVGMNSYIASTYKFSHQDPGRSLQKIVAEVLIQYLKKTTNLNESILKPRTFEKIIDK